MRGFVFRSESQGWRNRRGVALQHRDLWLPAHPTQSCLRHSMEMAARAYRSSVADPGRRPRLSGSEEPCRSSGRRCVTACRRPLCDTRQIV
jgi:hypothetical protein